MTKFFILLILVLLPWLLFSLNRLFIQEIPGSPIALVLGAGVWGDSPSPILTSRLDQAISLYQDGSIRFILVSGDNRSTNYNEPEVMKNYLVSKGIPDKSIIKDHGGRRTVDSCWRAKNVFKAYSVYIVTQEFHMPRAVFLCQKEGLEVLVSPAPMPTYTNLIYLTIREIFASWRSIIELVGYSPAVKSDGSETDFTKL